MSDLISRAEAIGLIEEAIHNDHISARASLYMIRAELTALPSAEATRMNKGKDAKVIVIDASVEVEQGWIPVSERSPENNGWYLVSVRGGYETVTDVSYYSADGPAWGDVSSKQKVIAWMPLPKPYRKDGE